MDGGGYDGLVDIGFDKHLRVNHGDNEFACGERHINGIESFWGYAKKRLSKFNGIDKKMFYLHLKETEYRFNHRHGNLYFDGVSKSMLVNSVNRKIEKK